MTWREDLRRVTINGKQLIGGSFRGVPFLVESEERTGGRRAVVHEFPLRDDPFVEDLGRAANAYRVEAYLVGDDCLTQRDALIDALAVVEGPGALVLPSYGDIRAICIKFQSRAAKTEGGFASVSIEFAESPLQAPVPTEVVDYDGLISIGADAAAEASDAELVEQYDADGLPAFALASAEAALTKAADALGAEVAPLVEDTQELAEFSGRIALLTSRASSLVRTPADAVAGFREAVTGLVSTIAAAPGAVMASLYEAYLADLGAPVDPITATRARELANQTAMIGALRRVLAIEAARLAPLAPYASIEEAIATRDMVASMLEEAASTAGDAAYPALVDLRSQVLRAVPGGQVLASVVTVTRNVAVPTVLLAYQLYGSVQCEADIIARNGIRHPAFVSGDVKVLSDG